MAIRIKARSGESVEQMLRRFKKMCEKEGLTKDVKKHAYYEKPSERRRRAMRKSVKRREKDLLPVPVKPRERNERSGPPR
jgi:small subunit ribosomal protein S21